MKCGLKYFTSSVIKYPCQILPLNDLLYIPPTQPPQAQCYIPIMVMIVLSCVTYMCTHVCVCVIIAYLLIHNNPVKSLGQCHYGVNPCGD